MEEMWAPVVKTSVTTAVGFLSFALSPLGPVRAFGIFTSVGIIFCMLWSLTAIPAMLALIGPRRFVRLSAESPPGVSLGPRFFAGIGAAVGRGRWVVVAAAVVIVVVAPFGVDRLVVQDSWINGFAADSDFYQATQFFNQQFLGTHVLLVRVATEAPEYAGEIPAADVDHHRVLLPAAGVTDPEALVGNRIFLSRAGAGDPEPDPVSQRRRPGTWRGWIESVSRDGDHLVVNTERRSGSPVISLRAAPDDMIRYDVKVEPFLSPAVIRQVGELEAFIESLTQHTVGGVIGTATYLETTNFMARGLREGTRVIPESPEKVQWLWSQYKRIRGPERLRQVVDPDLSHSLVTAFLKNANFVDVQALMDATRVFEAERLEPQGLSIGFAGDVAVSQTLIRAIVETQVLSLIGSLVGILAVTAVLGRSLRWGLLSVLPCAVAVLLNFAVMGWTGMPLGVATSMFAGMTLGIGVDYAIHLLERYRWALRHGLEPAAAVNDAVSMTGPAVFIDALAVALGFGVLTLSQVPANARLGALVVLSILGCLAATLLLLPALLRLLPPHTTEPDRPVEP
jgi:predicted RND superfamily exporter protein